MNEQTTKCAAREEKKWNINALDLAIREERRRRKIFAAKLNGSFVLVFLLSHFRDYINFQPTTKWKRGRERKRASVDQVRNFATCMRILPIFTICNAMWWFIVLTHIVWFEAIERMNEISNGKIRWRKRTNWNIFLFFGILVMPHLHVIFVHSPLLGSISRSATKEIAHVLHTHTWT